MAQHGTRPMSLRGESSWRGFTTSTRADLGDRRFAKLEGCYVSRDGIELRTFPGWKCVYDGNDPTVGFESQTIDAWRQVYTTSGSYRELNTTSITSFLWTQAKLRHLHCFKQMRGRIYLIGEAGPRIDQISLTGGTRATIASWTAAANCVLTLSGTLLIGDGGRVAAPSDVDSFNDTTKVGAAAWTVNQWAGYTVYADDSDPEVIVSNTATELVITPNVFSGGAPVVGRMYRIVPPTGGGVLFGCVKPGRVVYIDGLTGVGASELNGQYHEVVKVLGTTIVLGTTTSQAGAGQTGRIGMVAPSGEPLASYPLADGDPDATDDPDALASYVFVDPPDVNALRTRCFPSHVFNRQRDFGDGATPGLEDQPGHHGDFLAQAGIDRILSRRRQKSLPYRVNPDLAQGRVLLGAPGYGCVFQVPSIIPIDPEYQDTLTATEQGIAIWPNSPYDKPRSAGVPKAMMRVDVVRDSSSESHHFYGTDNINMAWGGFSRFLRETLYVESGTITGTGGGPFTFDDGTKLWTLNEWTTNSPGTYPFREGYHVFCSLNDSQLNNDTTTPDTKGFNLVIGNTAVATRIVLHNSGGIGPTPAVADTYKLFAWIAEIVNDGTNTKLTFTNEAGSVSRKTFAPKEFVGKSVRFVDTGAGSSSPAYREILDNGSDWLVFSGFHPFEAGIGTASTNQRPGSWIEIADEDTRHGTYRFAVAYRDTATGEVGLLSEPVELTINPGGFVDLGIGVRLFVMHPGYLMAETGALQIELYRTARNGSEFFFDSVLPMSAMATVEPYAPASHADDTTGGFVSSVFGVQPSISVLGRYNHYIGYDVPYKTDAELERAGSVQALGGEPVPSLSQMPVGAECVKTVRGITVYGGRLGSAGPRDESVRSLVTTNYTGPDGLAYTLQDQVTIRGGVDESAVGYTVDGPWLCAQAYLPPGYGGAGAQLNGLRLFPYPTLQVDLLTQRNNETAAGAGFATFDYQRWAISGTPWVKELIDWTSHEGLLGFLALPIGRYQWSIAGEPTYVPSVNVGYVDADAEEDIRCIGSWNGSVILTTRRTTYLMRFAEDIRSIPDQASAEFGGCAQNSMVEHDVGACWLSERGPVGIGGDGVAWIGADLEQWFVGTNPLVRRDSQGMMRHAWACHDNERGLVYFGVFTNRRETSITYQGVEHEFDDAPDEAKSRFPCDTVLIYSYMARAWSCWYPPEGLEVLWMDRVTDAGGVPRILFLAADNRVYALDDNFADTNKQPVVVTSTTAGSDSANFTISGGIGSNQTALDSGENYVRVGMRVLLLRSGIPIASGTLASFVVATSVQVTWDSPTAWIIGDQLQIGVREAVVETNWVAPTGYDKPRSLAGVNLRYSLASQHGRDEDLDPQIAAVRCIVSKTGNPEGGFDDARSNATVTRDVRELGTLATLGLDAPDEEGGTPIKRIAPRVDGQAFKIKLQLLGGAQVKLHDIVLEV